MGFALAGAVVAGGLASMSSSNAASKQADAEKKARRQSARQFEQTRKDNEPWRLAGGAALGELSGNKFMNNWQQDPGYQFRLDQGNNAMNAASIARGGYNSGRAMKELTKYGQDYASNEYGNVYNRQYNRLSQLAGIGQSANASNANAGAQNSQAYGNSVTGAANAYAAASQSNNNLLATGIGAYAAYNSNNKKTT